MKFIRYFVVIISFANLYVGADKDEVNDFIMDSEEDHPQVSDELSTKNSSDVENNVIDRMDDGKKSEILRKIISEAIKKPNGKQKLAAAIPIIRSMTPSQKLTLASMITDQLISKPDQNLDNSTAIKNMLPISVDIASIFKDSYPSAQSPRSSRFGVPYYNPIPHGYRTPSSQYTPQLHNRRILYNNNINPKWRDDIPPEMMPPPPSNDSYAAYYNTRMDDEYPKTGEQTDCTLMTNDICLEMLSYPDIEIEESISLVDYRHMFRALMDDANAQAMNINEQPEMNRRQGLTNSIVLENSIKLCPSRIKYARPKRAKSMTGGWKYVVNTGDYTQTVRMETCLVSEKSCSHLTENVNSQCVQIYNFHRLLTWDEKTGLSLDIFKIPTCCSCQVQNILPLSIIKSNSKTDDSIIDYTATDESTILQAPPPKPMKTRNRPNSPKREFIQKSKKPITSISNELRPNLKYSSVIDSASRRAGIQKNTQHGVDGRPMRGQNLENNYYLDADSDAIQPHQRETKESAKVNYNYHPIIDFFKTAAVPQPNNPNERMDTIDNYNNRMDDDNIDTIVIERTNNWQPITSGPRVLPK